MPTKPTFTYLAWAYDSTWSVGPSSGSPTKSDYTIAAAQGHIEGKNYPTRADVQNDWQNKTSRVLTEWVLQGSSDPDEDAHIVETDSSGMVDVAALIVRGYASGGQASLQSVGTSSDPAAMFLAGAGTRTVRLSGSGGASGDWGISVATSSSTTIGVKISSASGIPLAIGTQTSAPTYSADDGAIWMRKGSGGTADTRALQVGMGTSGRNWVMSSASQYCRISRARGSIIPIASSPSWSTLFSGVDFGTDNKPINTTPMLFSLYLAYGGSVGSMGATIEFYDGATLIHDRSISEPSSSPNTKLIQFYSSITAGSHDFSVRMQITSGGISLDSAVLIIETFS